LLIALKKGLGLLIIESCDKADYHNIWINDGSASMKIGDVSGCFISLKIQQKQYFKNFSLFKLFQVMS